MAVREQRAEAEKQDEDAVTEALKAQQRWHWFLGYSLTVAHPKLGMMDELLPTTVGPTACFWDAACRQWQSVVRRRNLHDILE